MSATADCTDQLLGVSAVLARMGGMSKTALHRLIRAGLFARPLKFGRLSRWRASDVQAYIDRAEAARAPR